MFEVPWPTGSGVAYVQRGTDQWQCGGQCGGDMVIRETEAKSSLLHGSGWGTHHFQRYSLAANALLTVPLLAVRSHAMRLASKQPLARASCTANM